MTTIARRFAARPVRTAVAAWEAARDSLCASNPDAAKQFDAVKGIAASVITSDLPAEYPFVFAGAGPRIRTYFVYDEQATDEGNLNESVPVQDPFAGRWQGFVPAKKDDLQWLTRALQEASPRFVPYDVDRVLPKPEPARRNADITIDLEALEKL